MIIAIGLSPGQAPNANVGRSSRTANSFFIAPPEADEIITYVVRNSALPHAVTFFPQGYGELDLHVARAIVRHWVVDLVELGHQAQAVEHDEAVRLDAGLVLVEAHVGVEAGHADVHAGLHRVVARVGAAKAAVLQHLGRELHHVDVVAGLLLPHARTRRRSVSSGLVPNRTGGPHVPV